MRQQAAADEYVSGLSVRAENAIEHLAGVCNDAPLKDAVIDMRCFKFRVRSTLDALDQKKGERRFAHVWVNEKDLEKAEDQARALLAGQGWVIESVELSMAPTREEIARLDPVQSAAHKRALSDGSSAYFSELLGHGD
jgi:uncharacterized protein (DUF2384 family)